MEGGKKQKVLKTADINAYYREYYRKNRSTILSKKYFCKCCNKQVSMTNKSKHIRTPKHKVNEELYKLKQMEQELRKITEQVKTE